MNTYIEVLTRRLRRVWRSRSFSDAWTLVLDLALQVVDSNRLGRAEDRALRGNVGNKKLAKIYRDALRESLKKDEFFEMERDFFLEFADSEWMAGMKETHMRDDETHMRDDETHMRDADDEMEEDLK